VKDLHDLALAAAQVVGGGAFCHVLIFQQEAGKVKGAGGTQASGRQDFRTSGSLEWRLDRDVARRSIAPWSATPTCPATGPAHVP
jgi:hypothetical protein